MSLRLDPAAAVTLRRTLEPIVRRAGQHLLASFERLGEADVHTKGAIDLVTRLDLETEALLVGDLAGAFPGEPVIAEETAGAPGLPLGPVWLVDPLDGTTNYVHGQPPFAVSVARVRDRIPELGVIFAPYLGELFWGAAGCGAFLGARPLHVSSRADLDGALLATGFPYDVRTNPKNNLAEWAHFAVRCRGLRRGGAASLDLAYVAAGRLDGYWEFRLHPWDLAAGALLVLEAGGHVTDPAGGAGYVATGNVVAANRDLHGRILHELARVRPAAAC